MRFQHRRYGESSFLPGDLDLQKLIIDLKNQRISDNILLEKMRLDRTQLIELTEAVALEAFNDLLESKIFFLKIDKRELELHPEIGLLLEKIEQAIAFGKKAKPRSLRIINRALLHALYPQATFKNRKHERFSAASFLNSPVTLTPLPPFFGNPVGGQLVNLSAGGMALLLDEIIPNRTRLHIAIEFPDRTALDALVKIKFSKPQKSKFLHGFEFQNLPDYMEKKIRRMAKDYLNCETRIQRQEKEICQLYCTFYNMCSKPQRVESVPH